MYNDPRMFFKRVPGLFGAGLLAAILVAAIAAGCASSASRNPTAGDSGGAGLNDRFLSPDLDVERVVDTFESESREIFAQRSEIVERLDLSPEMALADIGAGTGLFLEPFATGVGPGGKVYAVDISPRLVEYMERRARDAGWSQVETVLCSERSADLAASSVDLIFVCDTYHHFEFPEATLASLFSALRPGGRLVVVDFERIPGVSREWTLKHVRAGKDEVLAEIEAAGFVFEDQPQVPGLTENYMLRFRRP